jgi:hypothetical protein
MQKDIARGWQSRQLWSMEYGNSRRGEGQWRLVTKDDSRTNDRRRFAP